MVWLKQNMSEFVEKKLKYAQIKTQIWPVDEFQTDRSLSIEMDYMWPLYVAREA